MDESGLAYSDDQREWANKNNIELGPTGILRLIDKHRVYVIPAAERWANIWTETKDENDDAEKVRPILVEATLNRDYAVGAFCALNKLKRETGLLHRVTLAAPGIKVVDEEGFLLDSSEIGDER